jgi:ribose transport system permease protein
MTRVEEVAPQSDDVTPSSGIRPRIGRYLAPSRMGGLYVWVGLMVLFALWVPDTFLTSSTVRTIGANQAVTFIAALGLIIPLAAGIFDLSFAATLGVASVLALDLQNGGMNPALAVLITLAVGAGIGAVNGFVVVRVGINPFIGTLATMSVIAAVAYWITNGNQVVAAPGSRFTLLGQSAFLDIPAPVWYAILIAVVVLYLTEWTALGRYLYAVGGNIDAARLVGIRVERIRFWSLVTSGSLAAFAGIVLAAQLGSSGPEVGPGYLIPTFSAVLLGATQINGKGRVNVLGTLVAVVLMATGVYGLQLAGAPPYVSDVFNGVALLLAVAFSARAKLGP